MTLQAKFKSLKIANVDTSKTKGMYKDYIHSLSMYMLSLKCIYLLGTYFFNGSTGVYRIDNYIDGTYSCSCPHFVYRISTCVPYNAGCKHIKMM